jgi:membrane dipeptidase
MNLFLINLLLIPVLYLSNSSQDEMRKLADKLAKEIIIVDTHIDLPGRLSEKWEDVSMKTGGDFDYPRAKNGRLNVAFMSIYVDPKFEEKGAKTVADTQIDIVNKIVKNNPDKFALVEKVDDVYKNFKNEKISLPLGLENGAAIEGKLDNLKYLYKKGIRYITLTHAKNNHICDSSFDPERKWKGLSPFGKEVVKEMNRLGIMIDISHVSDDAFYQVLEITKVPVIASHSCCRSFIPTLERNMSDDMIKALAKNGGVIQIAFVSDFLRQDIRDRDSRNKKEIKAYLKTNNIPTNDKRSSEIERKVYKENPVGYADVKDVVAHINHVVKLVGVNHVGLGSDFDGAGDALPIGLKDVSYYPNLIYELLKAGYKKEEIQKICGGNLLRVWSQVEKAAGKI